MATRLGNCVRCFKPRPAATVERLSFGNSTYLLEVCDEHADMFRHDMYRWSRCGTLDEDDAHRAFKPKTRPPARNLGRLVVSHLHIPAAEPTESMPEPEPVEVSTPRPVRDDRLPLRADRWTWTDHAVQRANKRKLTEDEVLWCAEHPDIVRPGRQPGTLMHTWGQIKIVVNPETHEIITVAKRHEDDEERELQDAS